MAEKKARKKTGGKEKKYFIDFFAEPKEKKKDWERNSHTVLSTSHIYTPSPYDIENKNKRAFFRLYFVFFVFFRFSGAIMAVKNAQIAP